jgi:hypothetical protein
MGVFIREIIPQIILRRMTASILTAKSVDHYPGKLGELLIQYALEFQGLSGKIAL